jgi:transposase-like protein
MARRGYPAEFRRRVIELIERGKKVAKVARNRPRSERRSARTAEAHEGTLAIRLEEQQE